jgi:hypothetical protein
VGPFSSTILDLIQQSGLPAWARHGPDLCWEQGKRIPKTAQMQKVQRWGLLLWSFTIAFLSIFTCREGHLPCSWRTFESWKFRITRRLSGRIQGLFGSVLLLNVFHFLGQMLVLDDKP